MVHSLMSCNYLKIEESNHIYVERTMPDTNQRVINIQEQWKDKNDETQFYTIYSISIDEMTLRELILLQSIFFCSSRHNIV